MEREYWPDLKPNGPDHAASTITPGGAMKFIVTFKTPDAANYAINQAIAQEMPLNLTDAAVDAFISEKQDELLTFILKWVKYGECVTIEFDTEADTAIVVPRS